MFINISRENLRSAIDRKIANPQTRRSIVGMLTSDGKQDAVRFLEKQGIVNVDWSYHCQCGVCGPEPLVRLVK